MPGEILEGHVLVRQQAEANRTHSKGHYGRPLSGGALRLDLLEACYLAEAGRLDLERGGVRIGWVDAFVAAAAQRPGFETHYLAYRDLRERGYIVAPADDRARAAGADFLVWPRGTEKPTKETPAWMRAASERSELSFDDLHRYAEAAAKDASGCRLCIVDEESDLTYYELVTAGPSGPLGPRRLDRPAEALLLADRLLVPDEAQAKALHGAEFFGRPVGDRLQLSLVESIHLVERGDLRVLDATTRRAVPAAALRRRAREVEPNLELRARVYDDLRSRGLVVKTGFKFGTHFRAYESQPDEAHAPHLVQAVPAGFSSPWEPIARAIRLSHTVRKRLHLACVRRDRVDYLAFGRYRP